MHLIGCTLYMVQLNKTTSTYSSTAQIQSWFNINWGNAAATSNLLSQCLWVLTMQVLLLIQSATRHLEFLAWQIHGHNRFSPSSVWLLVYWQTVWLRKTCLTVNSHNVLQHYEQKPSNISQHTWSGTEGTLNVSSWLWEGGLSAVYVAAEARMTSVDWGWVDVTLWLAESTGSAFDFTLAAPLTYTCPSDARRIADRWSASNVLNWLSSMPACWMLLSLAWCCIKLIAPADTVDFICCCCCCWATAASYICWYNICCINISCAFCWWCVSGAGTPKGSADAGSSSRSYCGATLNAAGWLV